MALNFRQVLTAAREKDFDRLKDLAGEAATEARAGLLTTRGKLHDRCNTAAEAVAGKVTEVTGRETTAAEVKKAAVIASAAVAGAALLSHLAAANSAAAPLAAAGEAATGGSGDVMDQAYGFFARNGSSLNIETQYLDQDGCVLY